MILMTKMFKKFLEFMMKLKRDFTVVSMTVKKKCKKMPKMKKCDYIIVKLFYLVSLVNMHELRGCERHAYERPEIFCLRCIKFFTVHFF